MYCLIYRKGAHLTFVPDVPRATAVTLFNIPMEMPDFMVDEYMRRYRPITERYRHKRNFEGQTLLTGLRIYKIHDEKELPPSRRLREAFLEFRRDRRRRTPPNTRLRKGSCARHPHYRRTTRRTGIFWRQKDWQSYAKTTDHTDFANRRSHIHRILPTTEILLWPTTYDHPPSRFNILSTIWILINCGLGKTGLWHFYQKNLSSICNLPLYTFYKAEFDLLLIHNLYN